MVARVIAHRGRLLGVPTSTPAEVMPENTLRGIKAALSRGVSAVEVDVQVLDTGHLVLMHDLTVDRTTNGSGPVKCMPFRALRSLDAGLGERVPTLQEVLDLCMAHVDCELHVELKSPGTGPAVARLLNEQQVECRSRVRVSSFHQPELVAFAGACTCGVTTAVLLAGVPIDMAACADAVGASAIHMSIDFADPDLIRDAKDRRLQVVFYTIQTDAEAELAWRLGADAVISDILVSG